MAEEIWLLRHAETEWSKSGQHTGRTDVALTDEGRRVARALRDRVASHDFAAVFCSPLSRARETADLAGLQVSGVREELREWDYGEYEGLTTPEIRESRPGWYLWRDGAPGGETEDQIAARCDRMIDEVRAVEGDAILVAHGHILRALAARWVQEPVAFGGRLFLATGTISKLGYERDVQVIRAWND
jgi:broad specificity phosphatase PhoE